jgi:predicted secreted Zn-dependent protease
LLRFCLPIVCLISFPALAGEWKANEVEQSYAITGTTGVELYRSIGERGPKVGDSRVIAHTTFKLTWTRKYEPRDGACVLASAKPKLTITYTLPKPSQKLPADVQGKWQAFIDGVRAHEHIHGDFIKEMVAGIEAETVGLTVPDDPGCTKIKAEMASRLSRLSLEQRRRSRDFDRVELGDGGNVHQLILALVN